MIKVMLVDDERLIREGLKILLSTDRGIDVVGEASSGLEAFELYKSLEVDVILMDIRMPNSSGIDGIRLINEYGEKEVKVLILTTFKDTEYISEAIGLGASGYLLKDSDIDSLVGGIKTVYRGDIVLDKEVSQLIINKSPVEKKEFKREDYSLTAGSMKYLSW